MFYPLSPDSRLRKQIKPFLCDLKKWVTASMMLLCVLMPYGAFSQEPAYDEISVFFQVKNIGSVELPAVIRNQEVLLPVTDFFEFLKIKNSISSGMDSVSGFFLTPQSPYIVDRIGNKIVFQGKTYNLKAGDLIRTESNLYLLSRYFGEIFGLDCQFNIRALAVNLTTKLELPAMREMRLDMMRQNLNRLKGDQKVDTIIPRSRPVFHLGMADWSVIATQNVNLKNDTRINLSLGAVIAGGEANAFLNYNNNETFSEKQQYYYLRFVNNERSYLRQSILGKIYTDAISSIYDPVVGIRLSNTPTTFRRSFGTYPISDYTNPGWMVELYVNNVLVDYKKADASGFFNFQVPLVYGNSAIKLKFYGPWGEERLKEQQISVPFNFLPPKEFEYVLNAGMVEDSLNSIFSRAALNYGVTRGITIGTGVEYLTSVAESPFMPFANIATRPFPNVLLSGEYVYNVRGKGVLSYQMPKNILFELNYTKYREGQKAVNFNYLEERKAILTLPFFGKNFSFYNRMTYNQVILPGTGYTTAEWLISGTMLGVNTNLTNYAMFVNEGNPYVYTNLSLSVRLPHGFMFIPQAQYEYSQMDFISAKASVEKYLFKNGFISLSYENNLKSRIQSLQFSMRYDLPFARTGFTTRQTNDQTTLIEMAQGSLIMDHKTDYFGTNNRVSVGRGGIVFAPFLDINCNNKKDPGEPRVKGLNIRVSGGNSTENERDTTIRVMDLEPYIRYYVELDPNSLENVAWKLRVKAMSIAADPNMFKLVEIPVAVFGEVTGMVYRQKGSDQQGIGRIILNIYDKKGNLAGRTLSEQDGYYSFLGLPPGEFEVSIDSTQTRKLGLNATPVKQAFSIVQNIDGDVVDGMDFVLTGAQPETVVEEKKFDTPSVAEPHVQTRPVEETKVNAETATGNKPEKLNAETNTLSVKAQPKTTSGKAKYFYVQTGAFKEKSGASFNLTKLTERISLPSGIKEENGYFKVITGPFKSWKEAVEQMTTIQNEGFDCFIRKSTEKLF